MPRREATYFEFGTPEELLEAIDAARELGCARLDAYTPYPVPELDEKLRMRRSGIPLVVFFFGALGCALAYWIVWWTNASDYRLNVGGRPFDSFPADIPLMFETTVLFAGTTAFFAVLLLSKMPRLHHPIHEVAGSERITLDRFWLAVEDDVAEDAELRARLVDLGALAVHGKEET